MSGHNAHRPSAAHEDGRSRVGRVWRRHLSGASLYVGVRLLSALAPSPAVFTDSADYRWKWSATTRPYGISLLFDALGHDSRIVVVQTVVASLLWFWLFVELWNALPATPRLRLALVALVVILSLSRPITMWDRAVLSESLAFGLLAAGAAAALWARRGPQGRAIALMAAVLVAMALTREVVLLVWGLPLAMITFAPKKGHVVGRMALAAVGLLAAVVSLWPTTAPYGPNGATIANYRAMNVIGVRILPDAYLRAQLTGAGLPEVDSALAGAFGFSNDWKLYKSPGMLEFSNDFPTLRYFIAELRRPGIFYRYALPALDVETIRALDQFGDQNAGLLPMDLDRALWNWRAKLHLALLLAATSLRIRLRRHTMAAAAVWTSALLGSWIAAGDAVAARSLDALEQGRHAFPFLATSRIALLVSLVCAIGSVLGDVQLRSNLFAVVRP
jgi:hypothetical protein